MKPFHLPDMMSAVIHGDFQPLHDICQIAYDEYGKEYGFVINAGRSYANQYIGECIRNTVKS